MILTKQQLMVSFADLDFLIGKSMLLEIRYLERVLICSIDFH
jgi:hypothetical protein